jgi:hypothetical protein
MNAKRSRGSVMDQWLCGFALDFVLHAQALDLALLLAQFGTEVSYGGFQLTVIASVRRHEKGPCRNAPGESCRLPNRA